MLVLERGRRPHRHRGRRRRGLSGALPTLRTLRVFAGLADRHWAVTWACLHVAGSVVGGWSVTVLPPSPRRSGRPPSVWLARVPTCVLAVRLLPTAAAAVVGWGAVATTSAGTARARASWRAGRHDVWSAKRYGPSRRNAWRAAALVRQTGWPRPSSYGWTAPAVLLAIDGLHDPPHGCRPRPGDGIMVAGSGDPPPLGARYRGLLAGYPPAASGLAGGFDRRRYLDGRGIIWVGRLDSLRHHDDGLARVGSWLGARRRVLHKHLARLLPAPETDLAAAVLLGERTGATRAVSTPLASFGLAHLLAVSGLHVGVVLALVGFVVARVARGAGARVLSAAAVLPLFVAVTGMPNSVLRASGLALLLLAAPVCGRRYDALHALGLLLWIFVLWQPHCATDTGVRLSFAAAAGIVLAGRLNRSVLGTGGGRCRLLVASLTASTAAVWCTLPEASSAFGFVNPWAPLANLVAVPLFATAVWAWSVAIVLAGCCWPLAEASAAVGWLATRILLAGSGQLAAAGHVGLVGQIAFGPVRLLIWTVLTGVAVAAARILPSRRRAGAKSVGAIAVLAGGAALLIGLQPTRFTSAGPTAVQFAVGQGDACWIRLPDGWSALIDTGPRWHGGSAMATTILPWLRRRHSGRLDAVVVSHGHDDHAGGVDELWRAATVGHWFAGGAAARRTGGDAPPVRAVDVDTVLHRHRDWAVVLWPAAAGADAAAENDRSVAVGLTLRDTLRALWTADLETAGERGLVPRLPPVPPDGTTYWKAGHHGSATSGRPTLIGALRPALVGISCGAVNRYGHPDHGPYAAACDTACVARTDLDGSLYLQWDRRGGLRWETERGPRGLVPSRGRSP